MLRYRHLRHRWAWERSTRSLVTRPEGGQLPGWLCVCPQLSSRSRYATTGTGTLIIEWWKIIKILLLKHVWMPDVSEELKQFGRLVQMLKIVSKDTPFFCTCLAWNICNCRSLLITSYVNTETMYLHVTDLPPTLVNNKTTLSSVFVDWNEVKKVSGTWSVASKGPVRSTSHLTSPTAELQTLLANSGQLCKRSS